MAYLLNTLQVLSLLCVTCDIFLKKNNVTHFLKKMCDTVTASVPRAYLPPTKGSGMSECSTVSNR